MVIKIAKRGNKSLDFNSHPGSSQVLAKISGNQEVILSKGEYVEWPVEEARCKIDVI
jgi:hypothetical protein